jgi:UDP-N-acetylglucosamine 1-carboxyvinyltransferase
VDGSKNAALPLLAAAAATRRTVHLDNVPASEDVQTMVSLMQRCGCHLGQSVDDPGSLVVMPATLPIPLPDLADAARIRASYYLVPVLLAACGQARLPWPGGCAIGERGMDQHFKVYEAFGDTVTLDESGYHVRVPDRGPQQVMIDLPFRSRGASVAAILRAVVGDCQLLLGNPNLSPEVTGLLTALQRAGWQIEVAHDTVVVAPPNTTGSIAWTVPGDKIEAGTLACALAATGGNGRIEGVTGPDVATVVEVLNQLGIPATFEPGAVTVHGADSSPTGTPLRARASLEPGGLDADFEPALIALALGLPGTHLFSDAINPGRHDNLLPQLARLGARIEILTPTQCRLTGPQHLTGAHVKATDIRTGSALLIAALTARGTTTITDLHQLRRGYADLPAKLRILGADITSTETAR